MVIEMQYKITTYSEEETIELAQNIESEKFPNMVICLVGDLGSGKTVFVEMKRIKGGRVTEGQEKCINWLNANGYPSKVCKGCNEAIEFIESVR